MNFRAVDARMGEGVSEGVFPGAVLMLVARGTIAFQETYGQAALLPASRPMSRETLFDLSSLTKPLATTAATLLLIQENRVSLDTKVSSLLPAFSGREKNSISLRHLFCHCSGLPAWVPFYERVDYKEISSPGLLGTDAAKAYVYEEAAKEPLAYEVGTATAYSDLGFILLGQIVETLSGDPLDRFCRSRIFDPLGLHHTFFIPVNSPAPASAGAFAATEACPWRQKVMCGQVHDENAYAIGGTAGHAGLFSTAAETHRLVEQWVKAWHGRETLFHPKLVREFCRIQEIVPDSTWALGWDTPSPAGSSSGHYFQDPSIGHLGFTGTSIWIDLERRNWVILLTNRVHPSRSNEKIRKFRPEIHDLAMKALGAA